MKKQIILLTLLIAITHISAQEIIENTDKQLSKKAGRTIEFKGELRIKDVDRDTQGLGNMLKIQPPQSLRKNRKKKINIFGSPME